MSKKYQDICPAAVERVYQDAARRYKNEKEADKAARSALHQMTGAFMTPEQLKRGRAFLSAFRAGDETALTSALLLHASTRERLPTIDAFYDQIFSTVGEAETILDLACGLNPLYLAAKGHTVCGCDVHGGCVALIDEWAQTCGWNVDIRCADLIQVMDFPACDLALLLKLLPVLEQQQKGAAMRLLAGVPARYKAVSFPTRTLSGRGVGMEKHYSEWFEAGLPESMRISDRFLLGSELCYIVEEV